MARAAHKSIKSKVYSLRLACHCGYPQTVMRNVACIGQFTALSNLLIERTYYDS